MEITLKIKGEEKTFVADDPSAKFYRKALDIEKIVRNDEESIEKDEKVIDMRYNLIVLAFGNQFTKDELEGGLKAKDLNTTFYDIIAVEMLGYATREELEESQKALGELQAEVEKMNGSKPENVSTTA